MRHYKPATTAQRWGDMATGGIVTAALIIGLAWAGFDLLPRAATPPAMASAPTHIQAACPLTLAEQDDLAFYKLKMEELAK